MKVPRRATCFGRMVRKESFFLANLSTQVIRHHADHPSSEDDYDYEQNEKRIHGDIQKLRR